MAVLSAQRHLVVTNDTDVGTAFVSALEASSIPCEQRTAANLTRIVPLGGDGQLGWGVMAATGVASEVAGVVLVGQPTRLPLLDPGLLDWEGGRPALVAGLLAPGLANLYVVGLSPAPLVGLSPATLRSGNVRLLVSMIRSQAQLPHPLVDELMRFVRPSYETPVGIAGRRVQRRVQRRLQRPAGQSWWASASELDGPLSGARSL